VRVVVLPLGRTMNREIAVAARLRVHSRNNKPAKIAEMPHPRDS